MKDRYSVNDSYRKVVLTHWICYSFVYIARGLYYLPAIPNSKQIIVVCVCVGGGIKGNENKLK